MSKSLGNVVTIRDALADHTAEELRFFFASTHYRRVTNFCKSQLLETKRELEFMRETINKLSVSCSGKAASKSEMRLLGDLSRAEANFKAAMDDDFDTPKALRVLSKFLRSARSQVRTHKELETVACQVVVKRVLAMANVFGVLASSTAMPSAVSE